VSDGSKRTVSAYERQREWSRANREKASISGRDIGTIPPVGDATRRDGCNDDFEKFCTTYFPERFSSPFSDDHRRVIAKIERTVLDGGTFAVAMPRGSGKSTLCETACIWALVYGHRRLVVLIASEADAASASLKAIKTDFECNELLLSDFPEACYPTRQLQGINQRANGQLYRGERTRIKWSEDAVQLAWIPGAPCAGSAILVRGITGAIRGIKVATADGTQLRPDLVVIDDPQTRESANSPKQTRDRKFTINSDILGLAGPRKKIAAIMPCTVIVPGDAADQLLSPVDHPEWHGERTQMLHSMPSRMDLWDQYAIVRKDAMRSGNGVAPANEFFIEHRDAMLEGAEAAWEHHYDETEMHAVQHAMNLLYDRGRNFFQSECQNNPLPEEDANEYAVVAESVADRLSGIPRGQCPIEATTVICTIDVESDILFWTATAWAPGFSGFVIDRGTYPPQKRLWFDAKHPEPGLSILWPEMTFESRLYRGIELLVNELAMREWPTGNGTLRTKRIGIDANWGMATDTVYGFVRSSRHANIIMPWHGRGITASGKPISAWDRKPGETVGAEWMRTKGKRGIEHVIFDVNHWKTFAYMRITANRGDKSGLLLFGTTAAEHELFGSHCSAEYGVKTSGRGRSLVEWKERPGDPDNHWWDCVVGAYMLASVDGFNIDNAGLGPAPSVRAKKRSFAAWQTASRYRR
jgi:hypothetical protein